MAEQRLAAADWRAAVAVAAAAALAHSGALGAGLLYDDQALLAENGYFASWRNVTTLFSRAYFGSGELSWRPLSTLSHFLDTAIVGRGPIATHAISILLHALNAALCWRLLARLGLPTLAAVSGALVFATHPALVEATLLVSFREDLLVTTCLLGGCLLVCGGPPSWPRALAIAACTAGALGAKESGLVFPLCFALTAVARPRAPDERPGARAWWRCAAVCAPVVALYITVRFGLLLNPSEAEVLRVPGGVPGLLRADGWILAAYAGLGMWPATLLLDREVPDPVPWFGAVAGWLGAASLVVVAWRCRRAAPGVALGLGWIAATLAPVMNVVPLSVPLAERFCYLPAVGLAWVVAAAFARHATVPRAVLVVFGILALAWTARCHVRARDFVDSEILWRATVAANPRSARATSNLGLHIGRRGRGHLAIGDRAAARRDFDEAIALHEAAHRLDPRGRNYRLNRGVVLEWRGDLRRELGDALGARDDYTTARESFRSVIGDDPSHWPSWRAVASLSGKLEDPAARAAALARAEACLVAVLAGDPARWPDWLHLAEVRDHRGDAPGQLDAMRRAVESAPSEVDPLTVYATRLVQVGRVADALAALDAAPGPPRDSPSYHLVRAQAQLAVRDWPGAADTLRAAVARWPADAPLRDLLARLGPGAPR